jgi:hypothetical protein
MSFLKNVILSHAKKKERSISPSEDDGNKSMDKVLCELVEAVERHPDGPQSGATAVVIDLDDILVDDREEVATTLRQRHGITVAFDNDMKRLYDMHCKQEKRINRLYNVMRHRHYHISLIPNKTTYMLMSWKKFNGL